VIRAVPAETPVTTPVEASTLAIEGAELVHVPPPVVHDQVSEEPSQIGVVPVMV